MIKMVVFDLDGTLVNSIADLAISANKGLEKAGLPVHPIEAYKQFVGNGREMLIKNAMGRFSNDETLRKIVNDTFNSEYAIHCNDNTEEYSGCTELLTSLSKNNIKLGVLSNKPDEFVGKILKKIYPTINFTEAWGQKPIYKRKPDGEALLAMLEKYNIKTEECIYVGDSDVDVFTAKNAGVAMVGVEWGFRGKEELLSAGADYVCSNTEELLQFILSRK